ncbi:hypothetical protein ACFQVA_02180 [Actinomadura keratinilytica]
MVGGGGRGARCDRRERDAPLAERSVRAVERLERHHGFWLNRYDAHDGPVLTEWPGTGEPVRPFLSSVDNAWLVTGCGSPPTPPPHCGPGSPGSWRRPTGSHSYTPHDPANPVATRPLRGGAWTDTGEFTAPHYGALNTDTSMASYLDIADGSLPAEHYWRLLRTMLPEHEQEQPRGRHQPARTRPRLRRLPRGVRLPGLGQRGHRPGQRLRPRPRPGHDHGIAAQALRPGLLQRPFRSGGFHSRLRPLLAAERFSL